MDKFEKVPTGIFNKVEENKEEFLNKFIDDLEELFPETVKDGVVDFQALLDRFGEYEEASKEKYNMTWIGKSKAIQEADEDIYGRTLKYVPEESKNPETTENVYIEGDNLEVLKLLRQSYYGKINMIYIDPPYNTGSDFIYKDNFTMNKEEYSELSGELDNYGKRLVKNLKDDGRYHSNWLNMMYPRLKIARDLLKDNGVIFISIDDKEVNNMKRICDEVFGGKNVFGILPTIMNLKGNQDQFGFAGTHEYTLVCMKNISLYQLGHFKIDDEEVIKDWEQDEIGFYKKGANLKATGVNAPREKRPNLYFPVYISSEGEINLEKRSEDDYELYPITDGKEMSWRWSREKFKKDIKDIILVENTGYSIYKKQRPELSDIPTRKPKSVFYKPEYSSGNGTNQISEIFGGRIFDNPKPFNLIKDFLEIGMSKTGIILDFFSGSATAAHATMDLNAQDGGCRKFVMVQLPEVTDEKSEAYKAGYKNIAKIGQERIRRAGDMIVEQNKDKDGIEELDIGFKVFKTEDTNLKMIRDTVSEGLSIEEYKALSKKDRIDFNPHFTDLDVVYEMILRRQDIELSEEIILQDHIGHRTYLIGHTVLVCLEEVITEEMVTKIGEIGTDLSWIIMRDSAFEDNINLKLNTVNLLKSVVKENHNKEQRIYWI